MVRNLKPHQCPKYPRCSAAICPLDLRWSQRINKEDEEVCHLLRISQTDKADVFFSTYFEHGFLADLRELTPVILKRYPSIAKSIGAREDRPLRKPHKQKNNRKPKGVNSSSEVYAMQMQEWLSGASGRPVGDLNEGVGASAYPENTIHE